MRLTQISGQIIGSVIGLIIGVGIVLLLFAR